MNRWLSIVCNIVVFDALWTMTVVGATKSWWWVAPALIVASAVVQLRWSPRPGRESLLIVCAATGVVFDVIASAIGLFRCESLSPAGFVIVFGSLWINFGTTLRPSLRWMWGRPILAAMLGAAGGPAAYWTAVQLGAITMSDQPWRAYAWCGMQYAVAVPVLCAVASTLLSDAHRSNHPLTASAGQQRPDRPTS